MTAQFFLKFGPWSDFGVYKVPEKSVILNIKVYNSGTSMGLNDCIIFVLQFANSK